MRRRKFLQTAITVLSLGFVKNGPAAPFYKAAKKFFVNKVKFIWAGAVSANGVRINAKLTAATTSARLVVSTASSLSNPLYGPLAVANAANNFVSKLSITGLSPATEYFYAVEADGAVDTAADAVGKFKTHGNGPQSFRFSVASCNNSGNHPVFYRIPEKTPLFHITHGDFHYGNPNSATDINVHRAPFEDVLVQPAMQEFLRNVPIAYMWDDHDYCGDDTGSLSTGRTNARLVVQEYVPHYPLVAGSGEVPIYQAFTVGRVRYILSDLRSEKGVAGTTMMGTAQKAWFKNECLSAKAAGQIIFWICSVPWGGTTSDSWGGYAAERTELSDFFKVNGIKNLFIICGDAHMLGMDNGAGHDFSTGAANPNKYPVLQAAAVNQIGSYKGGTFSQGYFINPAADVGQYAVVDVTDAGGGNVGIAVTGYRVENTGMESVLLTYAFSFATANVPLPVNLIDFTVQRHQASKALLQWKTAASGGVCKEMVIERSGDGIGFDALHVLQGQPAVAEHSFVDERPSSGMNHYRLKIVEQDGQVQHSPVRSISLQKQNNLTVLNNPVKGELRLLIETSEGENLEYSIRDASGRLAQKGRLYLNKGSNVVSISARGFGQGVHAFTLMGKSGPVTETFMVAR